VRDPGQREAGGVRYRRRRDAPRPDFDLSQGRVLARCESHVAREDELAAHAPDPASDFRDAYDRRPGETDEGIDQDWQAGGPGSVDQAEAPREVAQIEVGKIELRIRTLEYDDTKARAGVHSTEQILEAFEHANVDYVKGGLSSTTRQYAGDSSMTCTDAADLVSAMAHALLISKPRDGEVIFFSS